MTSLMPLEDALAHAELVRKMLPMSVAEHTVLSLSDALVDSYAANGRLERHWRERYEDLKAEYGKQISVLEQRLANTPAPQPLDYCGKGICAGLEGHEGACST